MEVKFVKASEYRTILNERKSRIISNQRKYIAKKLALAVRKGIDKICFDDIDICTEIRGELLLQGYCVQSNYNNNKNITLITIP